MTLTLEQIQSIAKGTAYCDRGEDGIHFHRFTKEQEALYNAERADCMPKVKTTAGVRLDFLTDSRTLSLDVVSYYGFSYHTYPEFAFTVCCNGERLGSFGHRQTPDASLFASFSLPEGQKHVTVHFPWSTIGVLREMTLDDGADVTPIPVKRRMLMFGDSITHGYYASETTRSYAGRLADAFGADMRNKGIGGALFFPALANLPDEDFDPEIITVAYGTNDWGYSTREEFESNCLSFCQNLSASYPKARIFAITPIWRNNHADTEGYEYPFAHVAEHIFAVADRLPNVTAIHGFDFVPHDPSLFTDGLHPNDDGFVHYAANLLKALRAQLPDAHIENFS